MELPPQEFGRIAAQTAKQVILQRVRDAERDAIYSDFIDKEGKIVRGVVHRIEKRNVMVELGKAEGVITEREQIPGERYNPATASGPTCSRSRRRRRDRRSSSRARIPASSARLFEAEIPEIAEGIVQVRAAAREAGERAKVAVASTKRDVDPIGACVGLRGTRIQVISRELRGEKIDIVEWAPDPSAFVARALSPAKVSSVSLSEPEAEGEQGAVLVVVPDNQLSLAIGKRGQNARLAAKLTGLRVDIKSEGRDRGGAAARGGRAHGRPGGARGVPGGGRADGGAPHRGGALLAGAHRARRAGGAGGGARHRSGEGGGDSQGGDRVDRGAPGADRARARLRTEGLEDAGGPAETGAEDVPRAQTG